MRLRNVSKDMNGALEETGVAWQSWEFADQPGKEPSHDPVTSTYDRRPPHPQLLAVTPSTTTFAWSRGSPSTLGAPPSGSVPSTFATTSCICSRTTPSWGIFNQTVAALRFLYRVTLKQNWPLDRLPYGKKPRQLPCVLSQQEVLQFLGAIPHRKHRMALTTAYAAGLRVSEVAALRVQDIDSARMLIHDNRTGFALLSLPSAARSRT